MNNSLQSLLHILSQRCGRAYQDLLNASQAELVKALESVPSFAPPHRWQDQVIYDLIPEQASVLDLGCGAGELLVALRSKQVVGQGVERDADEVLACVQNGVSVIQGDIAQGLRSFADKSLDVVVCEQTLQTLQRPVAVLEEMLRVGRHAIVSFPNFGHWQVRLSLALHGRMPTVPSLPHHWYDTPNIHLFTIHDFLDWIAHQDCQVSQAWGLVDGAILPLAEEHQLLAAEALFMVE